MFYVAKNEPVKRKEEIRREEIIGGVMSMMEERREGTAHK